MVVDNSDIANEIELFVMREKINSLRQKRHKDTFPIETIPNFERCMFLCCESLGKCYSLKTHLLIRKYPCEKFKTSQKRVYSIPQYQIKIIDLTLREKCRVIFALRELKDIDERDKYLIAKFISTLNSETKSR